MYKSLSDGARGKVCSSMIFFYLLLLWVSVLCSTSKLPGQHWALFCLTRLWFSSTLYHADLLSSIKTFLLNNFVEQLLNRESERSVLGLRALGCRLKYQMGQLRFLMFQGKLPFFTTVVSLEETVNNISSTTYHGFFSPLTHWFILRAGIHFHFLLKVCLLC